MPRPGDCPPAVRCDAAPIVRSSGGSLLLAETETSHGRGALGRVESQRRYGVLSALGFRRLSISYRQPSLGKGKRASSGLMLLALSPEKGKVSADRLACFLREFYEVLGDFDAPYLKRVCAELARRPEVETTALEWPAPG